MMWGLEVRRLPVVELDGDVLEVSIFCVSELFFVEILGAESDDGASTAAPDARARLL